MKVKTSKLIGAQLDWAVAKCEGEHYLAETTYNGIGQEFPATNYSTSWSLSGPIIDREGISTIKVGDYWIANTGNEWGFGYGPYHEQDEEKSVQIYEHDVNAGQTPLIAAMRCFVASKLGEEVEIPNELM